MRRIISIYSILCEHSAALCEKLLFDPVDEHGSFIEILSESCLKRINNIYKYLNFMGLVTASTALLKGLGKNYAKYKHRQGASRILEEFLRQIVFCRPDNPLAMKELTEFFSTISKSFDSFEFLGNVCKLSDRSNFMPYNYSELMVFSNGSFLIALQQTKFLIFFCLIFRFLYFSSFCHAAGDDIRPVL